MSTLENSTTTGDHVYRLTNVPPEMYQAYALEFIGCTLSLIPYGLALSLFISCANALIPSLKRNGSRARVLQLIYVSLIFLAGTLYTIATLWIILYLKLEYPLYPGGTLAWELEHYNHPMINLGNAAFVLTSWFSDGFMMHRCYIVYSQGSRIWVVLILPGLLYLASLATGILLLTQTSLPHESLFSQINFGLAYFSIIASLHILLTLLIGCRLWMHRIQLLRTRGIDNVSVRIYTSMSSIFIESSALYSTFALLFIVPFAVGHPVAQFTLAMLAQVQVISPLLVNYRLIKQKAWTSATTRSLHATSALGLRAGEASIKLDERARQSDAGSDSAGA
ncbi:hypothetical protein DFP72DRAFT_904964 [Ephemerocybe angulata]|uniref:Uncharacterized protein n=1 Tax=Ephemerocybe angulata TaxID=980116 RepID=A0A8H6HUC7_9AGAR|nr:hypothetical protein DFP72DRAFT_904964 [Tulosesus angulatus]